eukprot:m.992876 g.992876  ORF g.992876 m.992876 type:complete len:1206 (-) comp24008_c0_seq1:294-3911(-)
MEFALRALCIATLVGMIQVSFGLGPDEGPEVPPGLGMCEVAVNASECTAATCSWVSRGQTNCAPLPDACNAIETDVVACNSTTGCAWSTDLSECTNASVPMAGSQCYSYDSSVCGATMGCAMSTETSEYCTDYSQCYTKTEAQCNSSSASCVWSAEGMVCDPVGGGSGPMDACEMHPNSTTCSAASCSWLSITTTLCTAASDLCSTTGGSSAATCNAIFGCFFDTILSQCVSATGGVFCEGFSGNSSACAAADGCDASVLDSSYCTAYSACYAYNESACAAAAPACLWSPLVSACTVGVDTGPTTLMPPTLGFTNPPSPSPPTTPPVPVTCPELMSAEACRNLSCSWVPLAISVCHPVPDTCSTQGDTNASACDAIDGCTYSVDFQFCMNESSPLGGQMCLSYNQSTCETMTACVYSYEEFPYCDTYSSCYTLDATDCASEPHCSWTGGACWPSTGFPSPTAEPPTPPPAVASDCHAVTEPVSCGASGCSWIPSSPGACMRAPDACSSVLDFNVTACNSIDGCTWDTMMFMCENDTSTATDAQCNALQPSACGSVPGCVPVSDGFSECVPYDGCYAKTTAQCAAANGTCNWSPALSLCVPSGTAPPTPPGVECTVLPDNASCTASMCSWVPQAQVSCEPVPDACSAVTGFDAAACNAVAGCEWHSSFLLCMNTTATMGGFLCYGYNTSTCGTVPGCAVASGDMSFCAPYSTCYGRSAAACTGNGTSCMWSDEGAICVPSGTDVTPPPVTGPPVAGPTTDPGVCGMSPTRENCTASMCYWVPVSTEFCAPTPDACNSVAEQNASSCSAVPGCSFDDSEFTCRNDSLTVSPSDCFSRSESTCALVMGCSIVSTDESYCSSVAPPSMAPTMGTESPTTTPPSDAPTVANITMSPSTMSPTRSPPTASPVASTPTAPPSPTTLVCQNNCGQPRFGGGTCERVGNETLCTSCNDNKVLFHGRCVQYIMCQSRRIISGPLTDLSCPRCDDRNCNFCQIFPSPTVQVCRKCRDSKYLYNNQCVDTCPANMTSVGITAYGRMCENAPLNCRSNRALNSRLSLPYKCACPTNSNGRGSNCHECTFNAGEFGQQCTKCRGNWKLYNETCYPSCAASGCPSTYITYGVGSYGNQCRPPFTCTNRNDRADGTGDACRCPRTLSNCRVCDWGVGGTVCTQCQSSRFLYMGTCRRTCPSGTTPIIPDVNPGIGRTCMDA